MLRAVDPEDRQVRREAILGAARLLFRRGDGSLPTSAEVATAAGLAKGTVYLYFRTKEEIFANVLLEGWLPLLASTKTIFGSQNKSGSHQAKIFIRSTVQRLEAEPELLRLDALAAGVLERNMTRDALLEYKRSFHAGLIDAGSQLDTVLGLSAGRGVQLLMCTYALTRGLWQIAGSADDCERVLPESPMTSTQLTFFEQLSEALHEYWRGALG